jgi:hypothetical protein
VPSEPRRPVIAPGFKTQAAWFSGAKFASFIFPMFLYFFIPFLFPE